MFILANDSINNFQQYIWNFYAHHGRSFVWRNVDDPYKIVISEIMLQQTQTHRIEKKFPDFIARFPSFYHLARASLHEVLQEWQGLGYNRRGKYLHLSAQKIVDQYNNTVPSDPHILQTFPGIGIATASSICAFAFNMPTVFVETNIRAVFIHHFFPHHDQVDDKQIIPLVASTVDLNNPREWYYALMDYGVMLKKQLSNPNKKSKHYTIQSPFQGSDRQIRGQIIKYLTTHGIVSEEQLLAVLQKDVQRVCKIINQLVNEQLIMKHNNGLLSIS